MRQFSTLAIAGIPGAGKTELATRLHAEFGWPVISTGDIARTVDPVSLAAGKLADEDKFRTAFLKAYYDLRYLQGAMGRVILDGIPRSRAQLDLIPEATIIALTCRIDIAIDRQISRGREGDYREIIEARTMEQADLLEVNRADGWLYIVAGWGRVINTQYKSPDTVAEQVAAYLRAEKREAF